MYDVLTYYNNVTLPARHFQGFNGRVQKGCLKTKHTYNIMLLLWMLLFFVVYKYGNTLEISTPFGGWYVRCMIRV